MRKRQVGDKEAGGKRLEGDAEEPSDWELEKFPFRLKELRTFATFPTSQHSGFYFPPSDKRMVSLSLQNGKRAAFFLVSQTRWYQR